MTRNELLIAIRQLCNNSIQKLDIMVKPAVVVKEYNLRHKAIKVLIDNTECSRVVKTELYEILRCASGFASTCRTDSESCRNKLRRIMANLPPAKLGK